MSVFYLDVALNTGEMTNNDYSSLYMALACQSVLWRIYDKTLVRLSWLVFMMFLAFEALQILT